MRSEEWFSTAGTLQKKILKKRKQSPSYVKYDFNRLNVAAV